VARVLRQCWNRYEVTHTSNRTEALSNGGTLQMDIVMHEVKACNWSASFGLILSLSSRLSLRANPSVEAVRVIYLHDGLTQSAGIQFK
jgi:hypothetical protein